MYVRRMVSVLCVLCVVFSLLVIPSFALEDIPEFDSDFVRYAPSSGDVTVGSDSVNIMIPWVVHSSSGTKSVRGLSAQCHALGSQHGHFTFVIIVGSRNNPSLLTNPQRVTLETIDADTDLHYYDSYLRPTNYRFNYSHHVSDTEVKEFTCIPFVVEFDVPEGETFTELYQNNNQTFISVSGEYVISAFFLYSSTKNTALDHLNDIKNYCSVFPEYVEYVEQYLSDIEYNTHYSADTVHSIYNFFSSVSSRYNTSTSRSATWDNMPNTSNPFYAVADMMHALIAEKQHTTFKTADLDELDELQTDVIYTAADGLPSFVHGISQFMTFFDVSSVNAPLEFDDSFLGYEDYWGNVPFFFSDSIDLGVQNAS